MTTARAAITTLIALLLGASASSASYDSLAYSNFRDSLLFATPCESAAFKWVSHRISVLKFMHDVKPDTLYMESKSGFVAVFGSDTLSISTVRERNKQVFNSFSFKVDAGSTQNASALRRRIIEALIAKYDSALTPNPYDRSILSTSSDCPKQVHISFSVVDEPASRLVRVMCIAQ
jgi:hypothetical protein